MTNFVNFKTLKRPPKPNTCLVAPEAHCLAATPDFAATEFDTAASALFGQIEDLIAAERRWGQVESDPGNYRLKFIATTGLMRFKDDVDIEVIPLDNGQSTVAIYSRSRVGYSDLGANRKRVSALIERLPTK